MKKERPIIFSTPMVQALMNGTKTQTRRIIKKEIRITAGGGVLEIIRTPVHTEHTTTTSVDEKPLKCPYGEPGDLLYVREAFSNIEYGAHAAQSFRADDLGSDDFLKWKPSIHMPKAIARIWLEVVSVRVERVNDITEDDAAAEGVEANWHVSMIHGVRTDVRAFVDYLSNTKYGFLMPKLSFMSLWLKINGEQSWDENPWVWVVEFKVVDKPIIKSNE